MMDTRDILQKDVLKPAKAQVYMTAKGRVLLN